MNGPILSHLSIAKADFEAMNQGPPRGAGAYQEWPKKSPR